MSIQRSLATLLLASVLAAAAYPVSAQGHGQGQGQGNGQGQGGGQGQGQGQSGGGKDGSPGSGLPSGGRNSVHPSDEDFALEAVRTKRALPLAVVLAGAGQSVAGEVIDARLVRVRGLLVYEVKSMTRDGHVSMSYYYASSGRKVTTD